MIEQDNAFFEQYTLNDPDKKYRERIAISSGTKKVMQRAIEELIKDNPEFAGLRVTQNYMIRRALLFWLGKRW